MCLASFSLCKELILRFYNDSWWGFDCRGIYRLQSAFPPCFTFWSVIIWHVVISRVFVNLLTAPENRHTAGRLGQSKMPLIHVYLNRYCHPLLGVNSFSEEPSIRGSSFAGALVWPSGKSEELREASVNNSKPIKITLHLSCDLYWLAFNSHPSIRQTVLKGMEGMTLSKLPLYQLPAASQKIKPPVLKTEQNPEPSQVKAWGFRPGEKLQRQMATKNSHCVPNKTLSKRQK